MPDIVRRLGFDGALSIVFAIGAAIAFHHTYSFPGTAAMWPRWVIGTFGVLSTVTVVTKLIGGTQE